MKNQKSGSKQAKDTWIIKATFNDNNPGTIVESFVVRATNAKDAVKLAKDEASSVYCHVQNFVVQECNSFSKAEDDLIVSISYPHVVEDEEWAIMKIEGKVATFEIGLNYKSETKAEEMCEYMNKEKDSTLIHYIVVPVKITREVIF